MQGIANFTLQIPEPIYMNYTITVQHPFETQERMTRTSDAAAALQIFEAINWQALDKELYDRQDEVIHYFHFYEIQSEFNNEKRTLTISPDFSEDHNNAEDGMLFMVRYEYPHPDKTGTYLDYKIQQIEYAFARKCLEAFIKEDRLFFAEHFETPRNKNRKTGGCFRKLFIVMLFITVAALAFIHFYIGWRHVPYHFATVKSYFFDDRGNDEADGMASVPDTVVASMGTTDIATSAPEVLLDTILWKKQIEQGNFIPEGVMEEYERAIRFDYSALQPADEKPDSQEAEQAIIYRYKQEVTSLLERDHAHIRIGTCYKAPLQNGSNGQELARVTAMVCAFDNKGNNLGNIQLPLYIAYDFVQYASDPGTWYITDMSQTIPYDYKLNKNKY